MRDMRRMAAILLGCLGLGLSTRAEAQQIGPVSEPPKRPTVAVVLSGGGAMGLAHIGVLEALEEAGIPIDIVVGTSFGAMVGAAYATGYSPRDMEQFISQIDWPKMFSEEVPRNELSFQEEQDKSRYFVDLPFNLDGFRLKNGLLLGQNVTALLDRMTFKTAENSDFDRFPKRFRAVATDIADGREMVFDHGSLADALRASMSFPALFAPYVIDGHSYVDGGVVDNLPIGVAKALGADIIIAVNFEMHIVTDPKELTGNPLVSVQRSMDIMVNSNVQRQLSEADVVITPNLSSFTSTDFDHGMQMIQKGREAAALAGPQLEKVLARTGRVQADPRSLGSYFTQKPDPVVSEIRVEGGTPEEQQRARQLFLGFVGKAVDGHEFEAPVDALIQTGSFDFVKIRNQPLDSENSRLKVLLVPHSEGKHSLKFGISYMGTYSGSTFNQLHVLSQTNIRGLTGEGSDWSTEGEFIDSLRFKTSYTQALGPWLFARGAFDVMKIDDSLANYAFRDSSFYANGLAVSGSLGLHPFHGTELSAGLSHEQFGSVSIQQPGTNPSLPQDTNFFVTLSADKRDSPVFPTDGIALSGTYRTAMPGQGIGYNVVAASGEAGLSLGTPFSVMLLGKFGSTFTQEGPVPTAIPVFFLPTLSDRRLFPGLLNFDDGTGNQIAAIGLELKYQPFREVPGLKVPLFLILQGAAGEATPSVYDTKVVREHLHWNLAAGVGLRVVDSFGAWIRIGQNLSWSGGTPYVAFDIGSFSRDSASVR